ICLTSSVNLVTSADVGYWFKLVNEKAWILSNNFSRISYEKLLLVCEAKYEFKIPTTIELHEMPNMILPQNIMMFMFRLVTASLIIFPRRKGSRSSAISSM